MDLYQVLQNKTYPLYHRSCNLLLFCYAMYMLYFALCKITVVVYFIKTIKQLLQISKTSMPHISLTNSKTLKSNTKQPSMYPTPPQITMLMMRTILLYNTMTRPHVRMSMVSQLRTHSNQNIMYRHYNIIIPTANSPLY